MKRDQGDDVNKDKAQHALRRNARQFIAEVAGDDPAAQGNDADRREVASQPEELAEQVENGTGDGAVGGREEGEGDQNAGEDEQDPGDVKFLIEGEALRRRRRAFFSARRAAALRLAAAFLILRFAAVSLRRFAFIGFTGPREKTHTAKDYSTGVSIK